MKARRVMTTFERDGGAVYAVHVGTRVELLALSGVCESMLPQPPRKRCRATGLGPGYFASTALSDDQVRLKRFLHWRADDVQRVLPSSRRPQEAARFTGYTDQHSRRPVSCSEADAVFEQLLARGDRVLLRLCLDADDQLVGVFHCRPLRGQP